MSSRLKRLVGKSENFVYEGITFEVKPFKGKEIDILFDKKASEVEGMKNIVFHALKKTEEDVTKEDVDELPLDFILGFMEVVMKVNGFDKFSKK